MAETRNIRVSMTNYNRLSKLGGKQDTFDEIISRLLEKVGA